MKYLDEEAWHMVGQVHPSEEPAQQSSNPSKVKTFRRLEGLSLNFQLFLLNLGIPVDQL